MADENEEFEFRARLEREQVPARRTPKQMTRTEVARQFKEESRSKSAEQAYNVGGTVTDIGAKVGLPPAVSAGLGYGAHVAADVIPGLMGGEIGKGADLTLQAFGRWGGKHLMGSALKPTLAQWKSGEAATAIDTMLERGLNVTKSGVQSLKDHIGALDDEVSRIIQSSSAKVPLSTISKTLQGTLAEFKNQVNRGADLKAIRSAWKEFKDTYFKTSGEMPIAQAHELKRGTYRRLGEKPYEKLMNPAGTEAQMSIAAGLRRGVLEGAPEAAAPLAEEAKLMQTLGVVERRVMMDINKNPLSLALLAHRPDSFAMFMADKSAPFKSLIARMLYRMPNTGVGAAAGAGGTISLQELNK